jgi:hypothetical protein
MPTICAATRMSKVLARLNHHGLVALFDAGPDQEPGILATRAGVVGYIAKGIALAVVGALFVTAAVQNSSTKATGLDGAAALDA